MQRVTARPATVMMLAVICASCERPSAGDCDAFAEHLLTVSSARRLEKVTPAVRESELAEAMKKKAELAKRCETDLTIREVACARAAQTPEELERCGW